MQTKKIKLSGRNRNEFCVCGSGVKYKRCCGAQNVRRIATLESGRRITDAKTSAVCIVPKSTSMGMTSANLTRAVLAALYLSPPLSLTTDN